jgi:methylated-DNA-protein-cysteine methyltransferase-like protein
MAASFFEQVHQVVRCIPPGKVATYGQIARILGMPHVARTVGWALQAIPEGSDVPWQRVINSRGTISFPPGSPGATLQRALLEDEGIVFDEKGRVNLRVYGWKGLDPVQIEAGDFERVDDNDQPAQEATQLRLW